MSVAFLKLGVLSRPSVSPSGSSASNAACGWHCAL